MPYTPRALSLSQILKKTFSIYSERFVLFLSISAIPNLALLLLQLGAQQLPIRYPHAADFVGTVADWSASFAALFAESIVTAATTVAVSDILMERAPDMWDSFARLSGKAFKIVSAAFLVQLMVGFGLLLCFIPGIYWAGKFGLAIPAAVVENRGGKRAMDRSEELTMDAVGRIIMVFFLTSICTGILVAALNLAARQLGLMAPANMGFLTREVLRLITTTLGGIVFGPISAIALALEYFDQRVRKEGLSIEQMMDTMHTPEVLAPGPLPL